jgi:tetratricopeptide (TPR) repeat protein
MYPVRARSIYALLALHGQSSEVREQAHGELVARVSALDNGADIIEALYLRAPRHMDPSHVPLAARAPLVDNALARSDYVLAARLVRDVPPGEIPGAFSASLRRARVLLLGGERQRGVEALQGLAGGDHTAEQRDALMQLVFDLQTLGEHESAFGVLQRLAATASGQPRRELLYWMGESRSAQGRHQEAADLYLRSAMLDDPAAMDPWAQTARYQSARALAAAGFVTDAEAVFRQLLSATRDPTRRAVLGREIEQLRLRHE